MEKFFFEEFVDWINERSYDELMESEEYKKIVQRNGRIGDKIIEALDGDENLVEKYSESYAEKNMYFYYFMCRKVSGAIVKIIADMGLI